LKKNRVEYNLRRAEIEKVQEMLTPEEIQHIADTDPRIQEIVGKIGPEKASELLGKEFADLAMSDVKSFNTTVKNLKDVHERRTGEDAARLERRTQEQLIKYGISDEKYWEATRSGTTLTTKDNLSQLARENYGWFEKSVDFATGGGLSHRAGRKMFENFEGQTRFLAECDKHLKVIGGVLQGTLTPDVRMAILKYMIEGGEIKDKKVKNNVTTVQDYRSLQNEFDTVSRQQRWETYKKSELARRRIVDITRQPAAADEIRETFAKREFGMEDKKRRETRAGSLLLALVMLLFAHPKTKDDIKSSLNF
jgi:hypothetical protein